MTDFFKGSIPIGPLPAWIVLIIPTDFIWSMAWHVCGLCGHITHLAASMNQSQHFVSLINQKQRTYFEMIDVTYSNDSYLRFINTRDVSSSVTHERDGYLVPISQAVVFFYRGHFEPWMYEKPRHSTNDHITAYSNTTRNQIQALGYRIHNGQFSYSMKISKFHRKFLGLEGFNSSFDGIEASRKFTIGMRALLATGSWMECSHPCKYMEEVIHALYNQTTMKLSRRKQND